MYRHSSSNLSLLIIDWPQKEIDDLDVKTRKVLTMPKVICRHQCMDRVYLPRREGGDGLIEINDALRSTIINLSHYLESSQDKLFQLVKRHHQNDLSEHKSVTKLATICKKENNILSAEPETNIVNKKMTIRGMIFNVPYSILMGANRILGTIK